MGKSGEKFIQHREEQQRAEDNERDYAAYMERAYSKGNQPSQRDIKTKQDAHHTERK